MKKQGDLYLKIVSIVLAGIVVAYLVLSVLFGSGGSSYTLETAVRCEAGDGQTVSGFVVREEEIITASQPVVVCALTEGERVGSGQRVADGYQTSAAREKRDRLTALQEQLSQLRYAASGTAGEGASPPPLHAVRDSSSASTAASQSVFLMKQPPQSASVSMNSPRTVFQYQT